MCFVVIIPLQSGESSSELSPQSSSPSHIHVNCTHLELLHLNWRREQSAINGTATQNKHCRENKQSNLGQNHDPNNRAAQAWWVSLLIVQVTKSLNWETGKYLMSLFCVLFGFNCWKTSLFRGSATAFRIWKGDMPGVARRGVLRDCSRCSL